MADAQTPVLTSDQIARAADAADCRWLLKEYSLSLSAFARAILAAQAPAQPDRAVMQQALDALQTLHSMQAEWHAAFPEHVGDKEAPAMQAALSAIDALSATMEKPNGN